MSEKARWARQRFTEKLLRQAGGLVGGQGLHPEPHPFERQADALACLRRLIDIGDYDDFQIGLFAQEIGEGGKRNFIVDTFAGFALNNVPDFAYKEVYSKLSKITAHNHEQRSKGHSKGDTREPGSLTSLYEVLVQDRPCWLYFDLEYSRVSNPDLIPDVAFSAFRETLVMFAAEALDIDLDARCLIELDSSTPTKFSKHVLVQRSSIPSSAPHPAGTRPTRIFAFANNAQAGLLVNEFLAYANARRHVPGHPAAKLFVQAPPSEKVPDAWMREVPLVDESVYSRNRCFRLLWQRKFGKQAVLQSNPDNLREALGRNEIPPLQLLHTMASFIPKDTPIFKHALIPAGLRHEELKTKVVRVAGNGSTSTSVSDGIDVSLHRGLMRYLTDTWDEVRRSNEPGGVPHGQGPAAIQSMVEMDNRYWVVTLANNKFCFCKGASHVSNHVYMVVDRYEASFRQKCHDVDCRNFRSPEFPIPRWLLQSEEEDEFYASLNLELGAAPASESNHEGETATPEMRCEKRPADSPGCDVQQQRASQSLSPDTNPSLTSGSSSPSAKRARIMEESSELWEHMPVTALGC
mmetsp:Transcript_124785/g.216406  ORF Transcript_124785/g.216406 Transcript_124785/m.216406 type:complete len:577 (+) Transcript_124785:88-1818(+)